MDQRQKTFERSVRERPHMYLGNDGVIGLFAGLITDYIELYNTSNIFFTITILGANIFSFNIQLKERLVMPKETSRVSANAIFFVQVLKVISKKLEVQNGVMNQTEFNFNLDSDINLDLTADYQKLCEEISLLAMLNTQIEIFVKDLRLNYTSQNYYNFPQGIFYWFDRLNNEASGKPRFKVTFEGMAQGFHYRIGLAYRTDWYPSPVILSFANNITTTRGGDLVDGVLSGLMSASRQFLKDNGSTTFNIKRKKLYNGLILVCAVKGKDLTYNGSFKEILVSKEVKAQAKEIVKKLITDLFWQNKDVAESFLFRFDKQQIPSDIY
ncbi:DNA gyrase/topoisomerase IV subunit B-like protein [Mucilaginibacter gracilis]|uniref:DNA topoisomerase (ATP-hydrolyzing) n=1 Tax=Mucilaginibacter gracilis TaxID=423350 RepID=A0A495J232_9SPHI|nr:hypothetical protein [Mucilaginibacter gracilis]RKR82772.1 DNA gyrase/topoisomerase IV subunit B-like protein [Mucilaginibacter gracilis]